MSRRLHSPSRVALNPAIFNRTLFESLLRFWLPSYPKPTSEYTEAEILRWFSRDAAVDEQCRALAGPALSAVSPSSMPLPNFENSETDRENYGILSAPFTSLLDAHINHSVTAESLAPGHMALALIILLDQMPRNIFRDEAQATVYTHYDRLARAVAAYIREKGLDRDPSLVDVPPWRMWFYLPLEHCESLADHDLWRGILAEMVEQARTRQDQAGEKFLLLAVETEERHYKPLKDFGRYPWRNRWLGRNNTVEEEKWLREGGDTFGTG